MFYSEIYKILLQLIFIVVIGGAITFYYNRLQKNRETISRLIESLASIHGNFLSIRYKYNSFDLKWRNRNIVTNTLLDENQIKELKWQYYSKSCDLIGEFNSIKPLISLFLTNKSSELNEMLDIYQEWRRSIVENKLIHQHENGKNSEQFIKLKYLYNKTISRLRNKI